MRAVFFIGLFWFVVVPVSAQTVLSNAILDTMIFEIKRGRQCELVTANQALEIESLHKELNSYGVALKLSQSSNETLSGLLNNSRDYSGILTQQFTLDKNKLKAKIKRLWIWVTSEGIVIVVLILLI